MNKPTGSFSNDELEKFKTYLSEEMLKLESYGYQKHQTGVIDMSSAELHVTNKCVHCGEVWMQKVQDEGKCPACGKPFSMTREKDGSVCTSWPVTMEELGKLKKKNYR